VNSIHRDAAIKEDMEDVSRRMQYGAFILPRRNAQNEHCNRESREPTPDLTGVVPPSFADMLFRHPSASPPRLPGQSAAIIHSRERAHSDSEVKAIERVYMITDVGCHAKRRKYSTSWRSCRCTTDMEG
jgi:hypothetical protein